MIVLIDNYDSFTYNLFQYLGDLGVKTTVIRNDQTTPDEIFSMNPKAILISPGPSDPNNAGICLDLVKKCLEHDMPLLGICLGHQAIGQALGGEIIQTDPMHGKTSPINHHGKGVFENLPDPLEVTRYHSLIINRDTCPPDLEITAETDDGIIMGVQHKFKPIYGVQFHPESIATQNGHDLLKNFCEML